MENQHSMEERQASITDRSFWFWLAVCLGVGLLLRCVCITSRSFDMDEVYELRHLSLNPLEIARDGDGFPPLYRWLLSIWVSFTGQEMSRTLSVAFGVGTIALLSLISRTINGNLSALSTAAFCSISAHQIEFSQLGRAYMLYMLCASAIVLTSFQLTNAKKHETRSWILFILACWMTLFSHYFAIFLVVPAWIYVAYIKWSNIQHVALAAILFAIGCIPWYLCLMVDINVQVPIETVNQFEFKSLAYFYLVLAEGSCVGPSQIELQSLNFQSGVLAIAPWAILAFGFSALLVVNGMRQTNFRTLVPLLLLFVFTPIIVGGIVDVTNQSFQGRYLAWIGVPFAILVGCGCQWKGKNKWVIATWGLLALNGVSTVNRMVDERYDRENYRSFARFLNNQDDQPAVVVLSHYIGFAIKRELSDSTPFCSVGLASDENDDWREVLPPFCERIPDDKTIYMVVEWMKGDDIRVPQRDLLISGAKAKKVTTISNTIEVYETRSELVQAMLVK